MNRSTVPGALLFAALMGVSAAQAQGPACPYTLASLQGNYAVVLTYGANVAAGLQVEQLDGKGNVSRIGVINQPTIGSATGARTVSTVTSVGTYTVNCDGTGVITRVVTRADGTTAPTSDDFMITDAVPLYGGAGNVLIATTFLDIQREPSVIIPGGIFVTRVHTRRAELPR